MCVKSCVNRQVVSSARKLNECSHVRQLLQHLEHRLEEGFFREFWGRTCTYGGGYVHGESCTLAYRWGNLSQALPDLTDFINLTSLLWQLFCFVACIAALLPLSPSSLPQMICSLPKAAWKLSQRKENASQCLLGKKCRTYQKSRQLQSESLHINITQRCETLSLS